MTAVLVLILIAVLVLANGGWTYIQSHLPSNAAAVVNKVGTDLNPLKQDAAKAATDIHTLVDNWVALCQIPDLANDPAAVQALDVLKGKILISALPKPAAK